MLYLPFVSRITARSGLSCRPRFQTSGFGIYAALCYLQHEKTCPSHVRVRSVPEPCIIERRNHLTYTTCESGRGHGHACFHTSYHHAPTGRRFGDRLHRRDRGDGRHHRFDRAHANPPAKETMDTIGTGERSKWQGVRNNQHRANVIHRLPCACMLNECVVTYSFLRVPLRPSPQQKQSVRWH